MAKDHGPGAATLAGPLLAALLAAGCLYKPPVIPIDADSGGFEMLVGEWNGDYAIEGSYPRSGQISFTLIAGEDHAHGDVLMVPHGARHGYDRYPPGQPLIAGGEPHPSEVLTIQFVRVIDGSVSGVMDPYWDPERQTQVSTTFHGTLTANTIQGTFRSLYANRALESIGHWKVTRHPLR